MAETLDQLPGQDVATEAIAATETEDILSVLEKDYKRLRGQKARATGGVEGSTLEALCMLNDEQYVNYRNKTLSLEPQDANKLYLTFNLIKPRTDKLIGRLSAFNAPFKARPNRKDPQALEEAEIVDRMLVALDEKVDETSRLRERLYWMLIGGTAFEYVPWVPNATIEPSPQFAPNGELLYKWSNDPMGEAAQPIPESQMTEMVTSGQAAPEEFEIAEEVEMVGEVGSEILGPFNVFVDNSVRSISDLSPDQWVHIAKIRTVGWVKENFNEDVEPMKELSLISSKINANSGSALGGTYLKDLIPMVQGSADEDDAKMTVVVESFQPSQLD
jgi:hypothetical protein